MYFDHIEQKTDDEVWLSVYVEYVDGKIDDANQQWSFVYDGGQLKYGTIVRNSQ